MKIKKRNQGLKEEEDVPTLQQLAQPAFRGCGFPVLGIQPTTGHKCLKEKKKGLQNADP